MTRNLPCRPAGKGKGTHRCTDTEAQQNFKGASEVSFLEANGNGDSSRVRLQLQDQSLLTILPIFFFFFETDSSACLITCNRRSAGGALLSQSLHSTKETKNQPIKYRFQNSLQRNRVLEIKLHTVRGTDKRLLNATGQR